MQFGVAEDLAVERFAAIENESIVAVLANPLDGDRLEQRAVRPTPREVNRAVGGVVIGGW